MGSPTAARRALGEWYLQVVAARHCGFGVATRSNAGGFGELRAIAAGRDAKLAAFRGAVTEHVAMFSVGAGVDRRQAEAGVADRQLGHSRRLDRHRLPATMEGAGPQRLSEVGAAADKHRPVVRRWVQPDLWQPASAA